MQWQVFDVAKNVLKSWQEEAHYQLHKYNLCRILVRIFLALFLSFFFPEYFWSWTWLDEREIPSILEHKICEFNYSYIAKYILKTEGMQESHSKVQRLSF